MILLDGWTVPGSSNVVLELVRIDEDKGTQEGDEHDQEHVQDPEESVHLEYAIAKDKSRYQSSDVVDEPESVTQNVPENWNEAEYAQGGVQQSEHL